MLNVRMLRGRSRRHYAVALPIALASALALASLALSEGRSDDVRAATGTAARVAAGNASRATSGKSTGPAATSAGKAGAEQRTKAAAAPAEPPAPESNGGAAAPSTPTVHGRYPSLDPTFTKVGSEMCALCHPERVEQSGVVRHLRIVTREEEKGRYGGCEACHGLGSGHIATADPKQIYGSSRVDFSWVGEGCLQCHTQISRDAWLASAHWRRGLTCNACHNMHEPEAGEHLLRYDRTKDESEKDLCFRCHDTTQNQFRQYSHHPVLEGRLNCWDCHDVHLGTPTGRGLDTVVDECVTCHANRRPPFVFEHEAVTSDLGDGCLTCHQAHGSSNNTLLKLPGNGVCVQCHVEKAANHYGGATCWQPGCHAQQHGSNVSPLFFD